MYLRNVVISTRAVREVTDALSLNRRMRLVEALAFARLAEANGTPERLFVSFIRLKIVAIVQRDVGVTTSSIYPIHADVWHDREVVVRKVRAGSATELVESRNLRY